MANRKGEPELLAGLIDRLDPHALDGCNGKETRKIRSLRPSRSVPTADILSVEAKAMQPIPRSASILGQVHPSIVKVAVFLLIYLGIGTICFYTFRSYIKGTETNGIVDALYLCVVTMTTVGYGDLVPDAAVTKLLACGFVFTGMALIALVLNKGADYLVEKQERFLARALHLRHKAGGCGALREIDTGRVEYKCFMIVAIILALMATGTVVLYVVEKKDVLDAFYCVCCTITTLGYGDQSFSTQGGRVFAIFWILSSTVCLGLFFLYIAELHTETRQKKLVKFVLARRVTYRDLEAADLNDNGVVEPAEFILFKLKEMGKIHREDISMVMEEFEELDVDQSGTISVSDVALAQSDAREMDQP